MLGFYPISGAPISGFVSSGAAAPSAISRGAGRAKRRPERWEVEYDGQVLEFRSAIEAHNWLSAQMAEVKVEAKKAKKPAKPTEKPVVYFDGVNVTRWKYYDKPIVSAIVTGGHARQLDRWIQARMDDDDDEEAMAVVM